MKKQKKTLGNYKWEQEKSVLSDSDKTEKEEKHSKQEPLSDSDKPSNIKQKKHNTRKQIANELGMSIGKVAKAETIRSDPSYFFSVCSRCCIKMV